MISVLFAVRGRPLTPPSSWTLRPRLSTVVLVATMPARRNFSTALTTSASCGSSRSGAILMRSGRVAAGSASRSGPRIESRNAPPCSSRRPGVLGELTLTTKVIGEVTRAAEAGEVIAAGFGERRVLVLAEVEAHRGVGPAAAFLDTFEAARDLFDADIGKAEAIDETVFGGQAEDARARVAGLPARCDGAEFHEAEAEARPGEHTLGIFVEAGGEADGAGEGQAEDFFFQRGKMKMGEWFQQMGQRRAGQYGERGVVNPLGIAAEEKRAREAAVEHVRSDVNSDGRARRDHARRQRERRLKACSACPIFFRSVSSGAAGAREKVAAKDGTVSPFEARWEDDYDPVVKTEGRVP